MESQHEQWGEITSREGGMTNPFLKDFTFKDVAALIVLWHEQRNPVWNDINHTDFSMWVWDRAEALLETRSVADSQAFKRWEEEDLALERPSP
jgi:hypothetical protein